MPTAESGYRTSIRLLDVGPRLQRYIAVRYQGGAYPDVSEVIRHLLKIALETELQKMDPKARRFVLSA